MPTKVFLKKIGIEQNDACSFCKSNKENLEHLLWECEKAQNFLNLIQRNINRQQVIIELKKEQFLLGIPMSYDKNSEIVVQNFIIILLKLYIYHSKDKQHALSIQGFKNLLKFYYHIEKTAASTRGEIANINNMLEKFVTFIEE